MCQRWRKAALKLLGWGRKSEAAQANLDAVNRFAKRGNTSTASTTPTSASDIGR